ncbi:MAG: Gfo/Idh/MocA family protein [Rubinisphaera brasiliensis]|uniref:Gfo/Idh/MocA family protein n=1 Tax=Rubinisphaera brasiliensis TaxID=119 RepID=UPI003919282C
MPVKNQKPNRSEAFDVSRRQFLGTAAGGALAAGVWSGAQAADESRSANQKLNIACIGTANRAAANINGVQGESIVALVDVDSSYLERQKASFPSARTYSDYREMLDQEAGKIDAVVVATTDHHHAPAAMRAIQRGLHVYCEKPLSHTVAEARALTEAAREKGVVTQLGTQIHAKNNYRRVVELVQSGAIGDISKVHVWVGKGWGGGDRPTETQAPPANLAWDTWLGPAPKRPYAAGRYHPAQWRRWWDFGQGTLGDMGCHYMDLPFWALGLKYPVSARAEGPEVHPETCPMGLSVHYEFPKTESHGPLELVWYDGDLTPREIEGQRVPGSGVMFIGSEGMLFGDYNTHRLFPQDKFAGFTPPAPSIPESIGHHAEWIQACKDGGTTTCNFDYSGPLTETVLLGNVAYRTGKKLEWDAEALKATNSQEADQYVKKEYREGWELM